VEEKAVDGKRASQAKVCCERSCIALGEDRAYRNAECAEDILKVIPVHRQAGISIVWCVGPAVSRKVRNDDPPCCCQRVCNLQKTGAVTRSLMEEEDCRSRSHFPDVNGMTAARGEKLAMNPTHD
jgi:hypothetical protein